MVVSVDEESLTARAIPKSMTLTAPSREIMTLAGLTSRWMMPFLCEKSSAPHTSAITPSARSSGIGPSMRMMSRRVSPSTSSMTMYGREPSSVCSSPWSYIATIDGWLSDAEFCASRRKRW